MTKNNKQDWTKVKITQDLIRKDEKDRTSVENEAVKSYLERMKTVENNMLRANSTIRELCPVLCGGYEKNMIPSPGWIDPVSKLCFELENLNICFKKYGLYVDVAQSKSKYAELRFYYDIHVRPAWFIRALSKPFTAFRDFCHKHVNFKPEYVIDEAFHTTVEWDEIDKRAYRLKLSKYGKRLDNGKTVNMKKSFLAVDILTADNVYYDSNGKKLDPYRDILFIRDPKTDKYYRSYVLQHSQSGHYEYRKHKIIHRLLYLSDRIAGLIYYFDPEPSKTNELMREVFQQRVSDLVKKAEYECTERCEYCGSILPEDGRFTKTGWITYLCEECAGASGDICSDKAGNMYQNGEKIKKN